MIRGLNCALLLIMFICSIAGKGAAAAFKFQIFCWVLFTPMVLFFIVKDYVVEGPPKMLGSKSLIFFSSKIRIYDRIFSLANYHFFR